MEKVRIRLPTSKCGKNRMPGTSNFLCAEFIVGLPSQASQSQSDRNQITLQADAALTKVFALQPALWQKTRRAVNHTTTGRPETGRSFTRRRSGCALGSLAASTPRSVTPAPVGAPPAPIHRRLDRCNR